MPQRIDTVRYLCSQMVTLLANAESQIVNLEEIWESGAVLECEAPIGARSRVEIRCGDYKIEGEVVTVAEHEFGYRAELRFTGPEVWKPVDFWPAHCMNPAALE